MNLGRIYDTLFCNNMNKYYTYQKQDNAMYYAEDEYSTSKPWAYNSKHFLNI